MRNNQKHLTLSDRIVIEQGLNAGQTFASIATSLGKDPTTISKEVRRHRTIKPHTWKARRPNCIHLKECRIQHLCKDVVCHKDCRDCSKCYSLCSMYEIHEYKRINKVPYVCFSNRGKSRDCVKEVFDYLTDTLGIETFQKLFPIILTDNGTEFQDTDGLECDCNGEIRTRIYYCHPNCSCKKV